MDWVSFFAGAVGAVVVIAIACMGYDAGVSSVHSRCELYGKARVNNVMLTCSASK